MSAKFWRRNGTYPVKTLQEYEYIHNKLAITGLRIIALRTWYLTEELVPLSLFVSVEEKRKIVEVLLSNKPSLPSKSLKRHGLGFGKPTSLQITFRMIYLLLPDKRAGVFFFQILNLNTDFLEKPVTE